MTFWSFKKPVHSTSILPELLCSLFLNAVLVQYKSASPIYDPTQFISPPKTPYEVLQAQGLKPTVYSIRDISHIGTELRPRPNVELFMTRNKLSEVRLWKVRRLSQLISSEGVGGSSNTSEDHLRANHRSSHAKNSTKMCDNVQLD